MGKWVKSLLGAIGPITKGSGISRDQSHSGELPAVRYGEIYTHHNEYVKDYVSRISNEVAETAQPTHRGDILFAGSGETPDDIGKCVALLDDGVFAGGDLVIFSPPDGSDPVYWGCLLNIPYVQKQKAMRAQGSSIYHIRPDAIKKIEVVYDSDADEQRHIAEILTTCDEVIEKSEAVVEKYRVIKAGMLKDLFTRGIGKNGKLRPPPESSPQLYKDTALGKVPREWEIKNLGEIGRFVAGNGFPLQYQGRKDGQYPFFKVSDFNGWANTNVMSIANHYVSDDVVRILGCNVIPARSIVFAKIGAAIMLERKRMVAVASCIDNNMMSLQVDGANDSLVLHFLQNYKFSDLVEATALPALKTTSLKKICLAIPRDPAEQQQIAERLSAIDAKIADELAVIAKYRKVKAGLMARLLMPPDMEVE